MPDYKSYLAEATQVTERLKNELNERLSRAETAEQRNFELTEHVAELQAHIEELNATIRIMEPDVPDPEAGLIKCKTCSLTSDEHLKICPPEVFKGKA